MLSDIMDAERNDPRWDQFADVYTNGGRYFPHVPNWTPFRQMSADTLNAVMSDCHSNVQQELDRLAGQFAAELKRQHVLAAG